ncbi:MAG: beta-N-acetylhexosaminidase [Treponemataceae bacterium]
MNTYPIPLPKKIDAQSGIFSVPKTLNVFCSKEFENDVEIFILQTRSFLKAEKSCKESAHVLLEIEPNCADEAYKIEIAEKSICIKASFSSGAYFALQTIRQFLMTDEKTIPCCTIDDNPQFSWRGLMLDTARSFFSVEFIEKLLDAMSLHRLNRFHWHLTDDQSWRIPIEEYPNLIEIGARSQDPRVTYPKTARKKMHYTHDEIRRVVEFAKNRHIEVIPEIETPGHASSILASYPRFGCTKGPYSVENRFGIFDDVLCVGNDDVLKFLETVFKTVAKLFPSKYIHIGGDECPHIRWKDCPSCQQRMKDYSLDNVDQLQSWMTVQVSKLVKSVGKTPIGWDEVLDDTEKLGLPKDVIVMSWRGISGGEKAATLGHQVIMAPYDQGCYLDYPHLESAEEPGLHNFTTVKKSYDYNPIPKDFPLDKAKNIIGGQGNVWSELLSFSRWAEYMIFPRLCAISEALWLPADQKDFADFSERLQTHYKRLDQLDLLYYKGKLDDATTEDFSRT